MIHSIYNFIIHIVVLLTPFFPKKKQKKTKERDNGKHNVISVILWKLQHISYENIYSIPIMDVGGNSEYI